MCEEALRGERGFKSVAHHIRAHHINRDKNQDYQEQTHTICSEYCAFETFNCSSAAIERQGDCGPMAATSELISAALMESAAVLEMNKSTSHTALADDSDEGDL